MFLISQLEENIYNNGGCTIEMQFEKACEALSIRFVVDDKGQLDVHGFIDVYNKDYWIIDGDNTIVNRKAKIISTRYFKSFDKEEELLSILALLTANMIAGVPTCVKELKGKCQAPYTSKASNNINRIISSMLNISNKELVSFYDMSKEDIPKVLMEKPIMSINDFMKSDPLQFKCEDLMDRYNNIVQLQHTIHTDPDQINKNAARMMIYQLQNDEGNKKVVVPKTYFIR